MGSESEHRHVSIITACDRRGRVMTAVADARRPTAGDLDHALSGHIAGPTLIMADHGPFGPGSIFARRRRGRFRDARHDLRRPDGLITSARTPLAYAARLKDWMRRFNGVATRYLENYLAWHRGLDRLFRLAFSSLLMRWPTQ